jgi:hypothetical protein
MKPFWQLWSLLNLSKRGGVTFFKPGVNSAYSTGAKQAMKKYYY